MNSDQMMTIYKGNNNDMKLWMFGELDKQRRSFQREGSMGGGGMDMGF